MSSRLKSTSLAVLAVAALITATAPAAQALDASPQGNCMSVLTIAQIESGLLQRGGVAASVQAVGHSVFSAYQVEVAQRFEALPDC